MPELNAVHIGLLAMMLIVSAILGWFVRSDRCAKEKLAVNAGWQKELESRQGEHDRLAEQNKSLMEQISQYQASQKDYSNRARELSESLKDAFAQRDQLQRQVNDIRGNLEVAIAQRDQFHSSLRKYQSEDHTAALKKKDDKIFRLSRELTSWQSRVPPLVERFQARNREAEELAQELEQARREIARLEELTNFDQTRIEPMDADQLPDGGDASNEPLAMTATHDTSALQDDARRDAEEADHEDSGPGDESDPRNSELADEVTAPGSADADNDGAGLSDPEGGPIVDESDVSTPGAEPPADDVPEKGIAAAEYSAQDGESGEESAADDLKLIKGIGPSIERTLNELGIDRFRQIADMSEFEIDRIAQHLRGFRSRIYREDWIGQARNLHYDKCNQRS